MKRMLSVLLAVTLLLSLIPTGAVVFSLAVAAQTSGYYTYTVTNGEVTITKADAALRGEAAIPSTLPSTLGDYPVTKIGDYAFSACSGLTALTIPNSVTSIGAFAFDGCVSLADVYYNGSKDERANIVIGDGNGAFTDAVWHYGICTVHSYSNGCDTICDNCGITRTAAPHKAYATFIFANAENYPFAYADGVYASTNKKDGSSAVATLKVVKNGAITIEYSTSTERIYDKLTIAHNSTNKVTAYGETAWSTVTIQAKAGDEIFIKYSKNVITSSGSDAVWFKLNGNAVLAEECEPTCEEAVMCNECGSTVKEALGHSFGGDSICDVCGISIYIYTVSGGKATITGLRGEIGGVVDFPLTLDGYPVTKVAAGVFAGCEAITAVNITDFAVWCAIDFEGDFERKESIEEENHWEGSGSSGGSRTRCVTIDYLGCTANPLLYAEKGLYIKGTPLTELAFPTQITSVGDHAFYGLKGVTTMVIPATVQDVGFQAFSRCEATTLILKTNIEADQTSERYVAYESYYWDRIDGGSGWGEDHRETWWETASVFDKATIEKVVFSLSGGTTSMGSYIFAGCTNLVEVEIANGVTSIGESAFEGCSSLTSVTIPDSVTVIGSLAFNNCTLLTSVTIPKSVTVIGDSAFNDCTALAAVHITDLAAWCEINFDDNPLEYAKKLYVNGELVTDLVIPQGVTGIGASAFNGCTSLTSVTIPDSVTVIGSSAFYNCTSLTAVHITDLAAWCQIDFDNNPLEYAKKLYVNGELATDLVIPQGVTGIAVYAFNGCASLTSVTIPDGVTSIGGSAFANCTSLASVTIPNGVTNINYGVFSNCTSLTSVTIPNSVTGIGGSAFKGCTSLTSVTMPNSVTSVGSSAFNNCTALAYVYYGGKEGDITIGSNNTHLTDATWHYAGCTHTDKAVSGYVAPTCTEEGYTYAVVCAVCGVVKEARDPIPATGHAYGGDNLCNACGKDKYAEYYTYTVSNGNATITGITDISLSGELVLPSTLGGYPVTEIGSTAFENCTWLTSVTIPDSVTTINYGAFYNCTALDSVTIGSRVTSIAGTVFRRCLSLKDVYYRGSEADRANITIGSYNDLLTDAMWHYVGTDDATLGDVDGSGSVDSTDARVTLQYAVQKIDGATLNLTAADVDGSGHVDSTDARIILQYAVRKIDKLPAA